MFSIRSAKIAAAALVVAAMPALVAAKHTTVKLANDAKPVVTPVKASTVSHHHSKLSTHKHTKLHSKSAKHHTLSQKSHKHTQLAHHKSLHTSTKSTKHSALFAK